MTQPTIHRWTTCLLVALGAAGLAGASLAGCTGDEFTIGGEGGGGGTGVGTPTTTSTGDTTSTTTSSGGECSAGCLDGEGECREEQSVEHCGLGGAACTACEAPPAECQEAYCDGGSCKVRNVTNGKGCSIGACRDGECVDVEVCLEAGDEDDNGEEGCADDFCRAENYDCSDRVEDGFSGPFLVVASPGEPSCPAGLEPQGDLQFFIAEGSCECEASCEVEVQRGLVAECTLGADTEVLPPGVCTAWATNATQGLAVTPNCAASPVGDPVVVRIGLATCVLPGFGCNDGEACMPPLEDPGAGGNLLCITAPGDLSEGAGCPSGWNIMHVASDTAEIACDCACDDGDEACAGAVSTWTDAACSMCAEDSGSCDEVPVPARDECTPLGETAASHIRYDPVAEEPAASGAPTLDGATTTFCCIDYPQLPLE